MRLLIAFLAGAVVVAACVIGWQVWQARQAEHRIAECMGVQESLLGAADRRRCETLEKHRFLDPAPKRER